ncbi:uncharacterized protein METZ01_LOCUS238979 [marine metagenome]|uniref:Methyltransferase type 11 domain-containing protein n=1 Tax=marine metagenome TaxID=408172 RepID=A0A382HGB3_9ZZZZ
MIWSNIIQPRLISLACTSKPIRIQRTKVIHLAKGDVLEIGFGSGHNLPFYNQNKVKKIIGLEPSIYMQNLSKKRLRDCEINFEYLTASAEEIPIETDSIDTVVCTYTLCSIPNPEYAIKEIRRVLKKGGNFIFSEHSRSPDLNVKKFQKTIEPIWKILADGCHLTRNI